MKISKKILSSVLSISVVCVMVNPIISSAALQSNGGTPAGKNINQWMLQIRQMQSIGGTLGRTDTIDTSNLRSDATDLDIHMEKNTEYGAMAILSASAYGNPNKIQNGKTTTGYQVPDAFTWGDNGEVQIKGYWMSKYQLNE